MDLVPQRQRGDKDKQLSRAGIGLGTSQPAGRTEQLFGSSTKLPFNRGAVKGPSGACQGYLPCFRPHSNGTPAPTGKLELGAPLLALDCWGGGGAQPLGTPAPPSQAAKVLAKAELHLGIWRDLLPPPAEQPWGSVGWSLMPSSSRGHLALPSGEVAQPWSWGCSQRSSSAPQAAG